MGSETQMESLINLSKHFITTEVSATGRYSLLQAGLGWAFWDRHDDGPLEAGRDNGVSQGQVEDGGEHMEQLLCT